MVSKPGCLSRLPHCGSCRCDCCIRGLGGGTPGLKPGGLRKHQRQPSSTHTEILANLTSEAGAGAGAGASAAF